MRDPKQQPHNTVQDHQVPDCLFCKIVTGAIPAEIVHQDDDTVAFKDIHPQAPHHFLIVPRQHIENLNEIDRLNTTAAAALLRTAQQVAAAHDLQPTGWRLVGNNGKASGQEVAHLHFHLLGGRNLGWPPG